MSTSERNTVDSSFSLLGKTFPFLILRFIVVLVLLIPFIFMYKVGIELCLKWFGDILVAKICYCYVFISMWYIYMEWIRKYVLYMLKVAQMASIAKYLTGEQLYCSVLTGFITSVKKVASAHLMFVIDCLIESSINKFITPKIKEVEILDEISDKWYGKFVGKALKIVANHIDEAILCYGFVDDDCGLVESIAEGFSLYILKWKDVAISSVKVVIGLMAFKFVSYACCVYYLFTVLMSSGLFVMSIHCIFVVILMYGLYYALYEPYICVVVLRKYIDSAVNEQLDEDEVDTVDSNIRSILRDTNWKDALNQERNQIGDTILTRLFGVELNDDNNSVISNEPEEETSNQESEEGVDN